MRQKKVIRCAGKIHGDHLGNILLAIGKDCLFVKCQDRACKQWTKITLNIPGIDLDLAEVGIVQENLPADYHIHITPATTVVA